MKKILAALLSLAILSTFAFFAIASGESEVSDEVKDAESLVSSVVDDVTDKVEDNVPTEYKSALKKA